MEITRAEMQSYVYDPSAVQAVILAELNKTTDASYRITDPTNPFLMLLEANSMCSSAAAQEANRLLRITYPSLALTADELYNHLSDEQLANIFSVPAETELTFWLSATDLRMNAYRAPDSNYVETIIPIGTEVNILGVPLTILNDISIKLYDTGNTTVEQYTNDNDISIEDLGILPSGIITDEEGVPFVIFKTRVKQVKKSIYTPMITVENSFKESYNITDQYYYSEVYIKRNDGSIFKLKKAHNEEYINPSQPTVFIEVKDKKVVYKIPEVYFLNGMIDGQLHIEVYETKGKIYLPINEYPAVEFKITWGDITRNIQTATITNNIAVIVNSGSILDGGTNGLTPTELRESIIYNTTGDIDLPITDYQIVRSGNMLGYDVYKNLDVISQRLYMALRDMETIDNDAIKANQNLFFNTANVLLSDIERSSKVSVYKETFAIHSGAMFKENNGIITLVDDTEMELLKASTGEALISRLKEIKYFITPYYYIIGTDDGYTSSRVYDLDIPSVNSIRIVGKNVTVKPSVNIKGYDISKLNNTTYRLRVTLTGNNDFNNISLSNVRLQLAIPLDGGSKNFIDLVYDPSVDQFYCDIEHDLDINKNNQLSLTNGKSTVAKKLCELEIAADMYIYTTDTNIVTDTPYLLNELYTKLNEHTVVLSKETLNITLGYRLDYIWDRLYNVYTDRKYLRYEEDVPAVYLTDVYEIDPNTGTSWVPQPDGSVKRIRIHKKGDPILEVITDANGNPIEDENGEYRKEQVMEHKKGDAILDDAGNPIIDTRSGILRYIDIAMLEAEFYFSTTTAYKNYKDLVLKRILNYLKIDMPILNNKLLENTRILYKSYKTASPVTITLNKTTATLSYHIRPTITLYSDINSIYSSEELDIFRHKIGLLLDNYLNKNKIVLEELKNIIKRTLGEHIIGVKINGIDSKDSEVIVINDKTNRLSLGKSLVYNKFNELEVVYDINLSVQYI